MIKAGFIRKNKNNGWVIEEKGWLVLKQKATGSVNSLNNYQIKPVSG